MTALARLQRQWLQLRRDPILRRWLVSRAIGGTRSPNRGGRRPPYLAAGAALGTPAGTVPASWQEIEPGMPTRDLTLDLAGYGLTLRPGEQEAAFSRRFQDSEQEEALHRFAWLTTGGRTIDPPWLALVWRAWRARYGDAAAGGPAWQAYTATERACNLLDAARCSGVPGPLTDTMSVLQAHGPAIIAGLEYGGEGHTSNHLSNNGRGLFRLGVELGISDMAALGATILLQEVRRLFGVSGMLREASSHYHLLICQHYADAWLSATRFGHGSAAALEDVVWRAVGVIPLLALPGGIPLIGDVSPDSPPEFLRGLCPGAGIHGGWLDSLHDDDRERFIRLRDSTRAPSLDDFRRDGWIRAVHGSWSSLWHVSPEGWTPLAGHGHQDLGGFELHANQERLFIDLGRESYNDAPGAGGRAGRMHNTILVDDDDPYPVNRPYYDDDFRLRVIGAAPHVSVTADRITLEHSGYTRLTGVGPVRRSCEFSARHLRLDDRVAGYGRRRISRRLYTPCDVLPDGFSAVLKGKAIRVRMQADAPIRVAPAVSWPRYGVSAPVTCLEIVQDVDLPWAGKIELQLITDS